MTFDVDINFVASVYVSSCCPSGVLKPNAEIILQMVTSLASLGNGYFRMFFFLARDESIDRFETTKMGGKTLTLSYIVY